MKNKHVEKIVKNLNDLINEELVAIFEDEAVPAVTDIIERQYDEKLNGVVTDRRSKVRPEDYEADFLEELNEFEFIKLRKTGVTFITPDMENFNFEGNLAAVKTILEGTIGKYYEMTGEDYRRLTGKNPIGKQPMDSTVTPKDRVYLLRFNDPVVKKAEDEFGDEYLVPYAFSNTPPIDIFEEADRYISDNMNSWIKIAIKKANRKFVKMYDKGR